MQKELKKLIYKINDAQYECKLYKNTIAYD